MDQIQDAVAVDAQTSGRSRNVEGVAELRLKYFDGVSTHQAQPSGLVARQDGDAL